MGNQLEAQSRITPATIITLSRFLMVPVFIYFFLVENFQFAVGTLVLASLTDMLDGFMARHFNQRSELGAMLDPLADKFMMTVSFLVLSYKKMIPWPVTALVIARDLYIVLGIIWMSRCKSIIMVYKPSRLSKGATLSHFLLLCFSFVEYFMLRKEIALHTNTATWFFTIQHSLLYVVTAFTLITTVQYTFVGIHFLKFGERKNKRLTPPNLPLN